MSVLSPVSSWILSAVCILTGVCAASLVWGMQSADRIELSSQLEKFVALNEEQRHAVRLSFADLNAQTASRQQKVVEVLTALRDEPALRQTLDRYYAWWSSLDQADFDVFQDMNSEDRLTFARLRMDPQEETSRKILIEFGGPVTSRLPPLRMTFDEFGRIIDEATRETERPPSLQSELNALSSDQHRTLRLAIWMFDNVRNQSDEAAGVRGGKLLRSAILKTVSDPAWKAQFEATAESVKGKPYERVWMITTLFSIVGKATIALGEDLRRQFPVTDEQIKDAFASLQDKELQQSLMTMTADAARTQLQFLAQTSTEPTPEEQLLVLYMDFAKMHEGILRFANFGFGGPGQFQPRREGGPGGPRDGRRIPSQDGRPRRGGDNGVR